MDVLEELRDLGLIPVIVIDDADQAVPLGEALLAGGLPCAEITFRTDAAATVITALTRAFPEMLVGAGTVLTVNQAELAVTAGSRFIVSPGFDEKVVGWCVENEVPVVPGVMTPTEITAATNGGLDLVKFFPAEAVGGIRTLQAMAAVFPKMEFIPTGGIDMSNLAHYLSLPMVTACGGSWVTPKDSIANGDFEHIERLAAAAMEIVREVQAGG